MKQVSDLTLPIYHHMPVYPGDPQVEVAQVATVAGDGCAVSRYVLGSHTGTHVDAPSHMIPGGPGLSDVPLTALVGPATVVDVRHRRAGEEIVVADVAAALPCKRLLLCTGWDTYFGQADYYRHPGLSAALCELLVQSGVRLLGVDMPNLHVTEWAPLHRRLLGAGIVLVEGLAALSSLAGCTVDLVVAPLPVRGADGAPARVFAFGDPKCRCSGRSGGQANQ